MDNQKHDEPRSLLGMHLGSEDAAAQWRREHDRRERYELMAAVARDMEPEALAGEISSLRREILFLRDSQSAMQAELLRIRSELPDMIRDILARDLPEAVRCVNDRRKEVLANGKVHR
jgi:hypothetical protein